MRHVLVLLLGLSLAGAAFAQKPAAPPPQRNYATAEEAVADLIAAARGDDAARLAAIFGSGNARLLRSGDKYADAETLRRFVAAYDAKHALVPAGAGREVLQVGPDEWPLPIPLVQAGGRWRFDTAAGVQEVIDRRIGRNEIAAIRTSLTYVDAQEDYFDRAKRAGTAQYAQRLASTPGRQDGLYWPAEDGDESPLEPLVAQAREDGYPVDGTGGAGGPRPYHGYFFRILKAQGPDADGGAKSYVKDGRMTEGFALVAWPASYGASGIMTFQVNQDGVVYQKDLGDDTARRAAAITRFDPDLSWARVNITP